jgi:hypothetical protein
MREKGVFQSLAFAWAFLPMHTSLAFSAGDVPSGILTYQERQGDHRLAFHWQAEDMGRYVLVSVSEQHKGFENFCDTKGWTVRWKMFDDGENSRIEVKREGNELIIDGIRKAKFYHETVNIDDRPWFQPLSFSLRTFLDSPEQAITFWTVRADTIEPVPLEAKKLGSDEIIIEGKNVSADKIEVRAEGFYSSFWHGTYWYRRGDHLFMMYRSVQGLPGTAETVVTLNDPRVLQAQPQQHHGG